MKVLLKFKYSNLESKNDHMLFTQKVQTFAVFLLLMFTIISCSDSSTGVESNNETAIINGSVEGETSQEKEVVQKNNQEIHTVSVAQITSNGSIEIIEGSETETDSDGNFSVEVDAASANHIVVVAEGSGGQIMAFIPSEVENNNSYTVKPLNSESTAETAVFAEVISNGNADLVQKSHIELLISSEAASDIHSNSAAASELAAAFAANAETRSEFFEEFSNESSLNDALQAITQAHIQYHQELHASGSANEDAYESFMHATIDTYADAGLEMSDVTKMMHAQAEVMQSSMNSVSSEVENSVRASASIMASVALDSAVQAHAEASGVSETTLSAISEAGTTLQTAIYSSSGTTSEISDAFSSYHQEVRTSFENDESVEATIIIATDTEINTIGGAKIDFENALSQFLQLDSVISVYTDFAMNIQNSVETHSELHGEIDTDAATNIVLLINLFS